MDNFTTSATNPSSLDTSKMIELIDWFNQNHPIPVKETIIVLSSFLNHMDCAFDVDDYEGKHYILMGEWDFMNMIDNMMIQSKPTNILGDWFYGVPVIKDNKLAMDIIQAKTISVILNAKAPTFFSRGFGVTGT